MYVIKRDEEDADKKRMIERRLKSDPKFKEFYGRTMEQTEALSLEQLALDRRFTHKQIRVQKALGAKSIAGTAGKSIALRRAMERRINEV